VGYWGLSRGKKRKYNSDQESYPPTKRIGKKSDKSPNENFIKTVNRNGKISATSGGYSGLGRLGNFAAMKRNLQEILNDDQSDSSDLSSLESDELLESDYDLFEQTGYNQKKSFSGKEVS
jgi:hypothetical protein